jgi:hypothetical protein
LIAGPADTTNLNEDGVNVGESSSVKANDLEEVGDDGCDLLSLQSDDVSVIDPPENTRLTTR